MESAGAKRSVRITPEERIASVDALRGFDMFWIVGGQAVVMSFAALFANPLPAWFDRQFHHVPWEGFTGWDLIMPLFLFVVGVAMPFSFGKRLEAHQSKGRIYWKIVRRVLILFVLGMMAQGRLLEFDPSRLHIYCNTLQSIACGYLVAAVVMLNLPIIGQFLATATLLIGYWLLMIFVPVPGHTAGMLDPQVNLAMYIDETILGRFRDGTTYTWILSSMGFAASVLLGVLGGHILRMKASGTKRALCIMLAGLACLVLGWVWGYRFSIIKHIWTSSMVLWAAGWSYLLLAFFYYVIDVKGYRKWAFPLVVIGMNAIFVYMATELYDFQHISDIFLAGPARFLGVFGVFLRELGAFMVVWLILLYMYRKRTFIRI